MSKIEQSTHSFGIGSGWTSWLDNDELNYADGTCFTKDGIIILYWQVDDGVNNASARIMHKGRVYELDLEGKITKLGLVRMAKKWAREIRRSK